ncbi:Ig-like domain repeat protein [Solirubrobacter taibaiensis]|nr:Ig-like domain repeat protein [Solirubrobacter taibaiensis]
MLKVPRVGALLGGVALAAMLAPATAGAQAPVVSPQVVHTGTAPTGYEVTFRVSDPSAQRMRIKGEWAFSSAADSSASPPAANCPILVCGSAAGRLPAQWRAGDFPLASPNITAGSWPVNDMVKDANGVWSFTTPLPSGTYSYSLYRNCDAPAPGLAGCTGKSDPANPPWNNVNGVITGSEESLSQVYVPSDPAFGTADVSWQAPVAPAQRGTLVSREYASPLATACTNDQRCTTPAGRHDLAIYTPPGYDANRATPYPLFVISQGGGGNEVDWSTQGVLNRIVDNLLATGKIQPMVIVATNFNNISGGNAGYADDVINAVIPFVESNYNVAKTPSGRAFAGLSAGGQRGNELLYNPGGLNRPHAFGYYGIWSAGGTPPAEGSPLYLNPDLKKLLGLQIGGGIQDPIVAGTLDPQARLRAAGVPFVSEMINGGHTWDVWRSLLRSYLSKVAFRTTSTTVVANGSARTLRATVAAATSQPAVPTGTVQFAVGGQPLGAPVSLVGGAASITLPATIGYSAVTVTYSGDTLYNASSQSATYAPSSVEGTVGGTVPATLSLTLGTPGSFGAFAVGVTRTYEATTTANVVSTAGDATLSVSDPSTTATGRLINGTFSLPQPLQARARNAANTGTAYNNVGSSASPLNLLTYGGPVSNDAVTLQFSQLINANDVLRTGAYGKTLTFTLSTTTP